MDSIITNNPSPKSRFVSDTKRVAAHRSMVRTNEFQNATDMAMLEYQRRLSEQDAQTNGQVAAANHFKITGAQEFVHVLKNLSETPKPQIVDRVGDNLNHQT